MATRLLCCKNRWVNDPLGAIAVLCCAFKPRYAVWSREIDLVRIVILGGAWQRSKWYFWLHEKYMYLAGATMRRVTRHAGSVGEGIGTQNARSTKFEKKDHGLVGRKERRSGGCWCSWSYLCLRSGTTPSGSRTGASHQGQHATRPGGGDGWIASSSPPSYHSDPVPPLWRSESQYSHPHRTQLDDYLSGDSLARLLLRHASFWHVVLLDSSLRGCFQGYRALLPAVQCQGGQCTSVDQLLCQDARVNYTRA